MTTQTLLDIVENRRKMAKGTSPTEAEFFEAIGSALQKLIELEKEHEERERNEL